MKDSDGKGAIPVEDEPCPRLKQRHARKDNPVHQPWRKLGRVRGAQGFVGGEDGEENGEERTGLDYVSIGRVVSL